jgi:inosine-uridine nucleoside N-ribohydrolase
MSAETMKHRIVLDTDMGTDVDDALCLALALASPEIELMAVTHVSRDTRLRARITRRLLDLAGRGDVPAYAGCAATRGGGDTFAWFGHEGEGIIDGAYDPALPDEHAVDALLRIFHSEPHIELVAVGPMTNVAMALERDPSLAGRIERLTIMGGHLRRVGYGGKEFAPGVDYNLCSDPQAARVVLGAGIPTRLVTADVTLQTWLGDADVRRLEESTLALHRTLTRAVRVWTPIQNRIFSGLGARMDADNAAFLHDPLALACVYDESFATFEDLSIEPLIEEGTFRTLERAPGCPGTYRMRCATAVDAGRFRAHFVERVLSLR